MQEYTNPESAETPKKTNGTRETRQVILDSARRLFNERGVSDVSMRAIAADANISVGNLTYHFPRKRDLVSALMADDIHETLVRESSTGLERLNSIFEGMLRALLRNPFFFLDDQARTMISPQDVDNVQQVHGQINPVLDDLIADGLLKPDFQGETRMNVISVLLLAHITWLKTVVRPGPFPAMTFDEMIGAHWTILSPWLTEAGIRERETMLSAKAAKR